MDQTEICNLALLRLGITQRIADITENSTQARACLAVYEQCIRTMLRERPWPFAVREVDLALVGTNLFSDWSYTYRYPSGFIHIHRVTPTLVDSGDTSVVFVTKMRDEGLQTYPFGIGSDDTGRLIHTDLTEARALGTVYISDTNQYDPMFSSALAWYIAAEIAVSLTKSRDLYTNAYAQYENTVSSAFASAANEPKPRDSREADMIRARD